MTSELGMATGRVDGREHIPYPVPAHIPVSHLCLVSCCGKKNFPHFRSGIDLYTHPCPRPRWGIRFFPNVGRGIPPHYHPYS